MVPTLPCLSPGELEGDLGKLTFPGEQRQPIQVSKFTLVSMNNRIQGPSKEIFCISRNAPRGESIRKNKLTASLLPSSTIRDTSSDDISCESPKLSTSGFYEHRGWKER